MQMRGSLYPLMALLLPVLLFGSLPLLSSMNPVRCACSRSRSDMAVRWLCGLCVGVCLS